MFGTVLKIKELLFDSILYRSPGPDPFPAGFFLLIFPNSTLVLNFSDFSLGILHFFSIFLSHD